MSGAEHKVLKNNRNSDEIFMKGRIYRVAGAEIDPDRASLTRDGEVIVLRAKTYRVLLYPMERPNRLVTTTSGDGLSYLRIVPRITQNAAT